METTLTSKLIKTTTNTDGSSLVWIPSELRGYSMVSCNSAADCASSDTATLTIPAIGVTYYVPRFDLLATPFEDHVNEFNTGHMNVSETYSGVIIKRAGRVRITARAVLLANTGVTSATISILKGGTLATTVLTSPTVLEASAVITAANDVQAYLEVCTYAVVAADDIIRAGMQGTMTADTTSNVAYSLIVEHV